MERYLFNKHLPPNGEERSLQYLSCPRPIKRGPFPVEIFTSCEVRFCLSTRVLFSPPISFFICILCARLDALLHRQIKESTRSAGERLHIAINLTPEREKDLAKYRRAREKKRRKPPRIKHQKEESVKKRKATTPPAREREKSITSQQAEKKKSNHVCVCVWWHACVGAWIGFCGVTALTPTLLHH
ncbi:hypothetical protein CEXT_793391 [Caerostris extrusa]|uniref:Uncharacterized protein n=1 Tax=Caerostris extrusa TaxID=172846 RepID=A0AAV4SUN1_CAEEX|nr:hypothetical protein CEXT_793391 [Caerostris extrusa]